jgi:hypothetical protein
MDALMGVISGLESSHAEPSDCGRMGIGARQCRMAAAELQG